MGSPASVARLRHLGHEVGVEYRVDGHAVTVFERRLMARQGFTEGGVARLRTLGALANGGLLAACRSEVAFVHPLVQARPFGLVTEIETDPTHVSLAERAA